MEVTVWKDYMTDCWQIKFKEEKGKHNSYMKDRVFKRGCVFVISEELIKQKMNNVPEGCEYPKFTL